MSGTEDNIETGDQREVALSVTDSVKRGDGWCLKAYKLNDKVERKQLIDRLSVHNVQEEKFGPAFVPALMPGKRRGEKHVIWLEFFVADIDNGMSADDVIATVDATENWSIVTTSHSHGKEASEVPLDQLKKYNDKNNVPHDDRKTKANIEAFVDSHARYAGVGEFELLSDEPRLTNNAYFFDIRHQPFEKTRAIFLLEAPFVFLLESPDALGYHYDHETSDFQWTRPDAQADIAIVWKEGLYPAIAEAIGLPIDKACKDPSHTYFLPACHPAREDLKRSVAQTDRPCLDWRDYKDAAREKLIAYEERKCRPKGKAKPSTKIAKSVGARSGDSSNNVEREHSHELNVWLAKYGKTYQLATMLEAEYPELIKGDRDHGGCFVECANEMDHQEAHARTFVTDPDPDSPHGESFVFHCSGAQCDGVDRAGRLQIWLDDGVISWSDLENEEYGGGKITPKKTSEKPSKKDDDRGYPADEPTFDPDAVCWHFVNGQGSPIEHARACADTFLKVNSAAPAVFRSFDVIVQVRKDPDTRVAKARNISADDLQFMIDGTIATWQSKTGKDSYKDSAMPMQVAKYVMQLIYERLPRLDGIADTPFFDKDGQLVAEPGYHANSHTFYAPHIDLNVTLPPANPTPEQIEAARLEVIDPFCDFPFEDESGLAHIISMLLHQQTRAMIDGPFMSPLIHKPQPGEGASLSMDVVSLINSGRLLPTQTEKRDDEEWRKMFTGELLAGSSLIVIDNVNRRIEGSAIAAFITSRRWVDRLLGKNEKVDVENNCLLVFTGNNPEWSEEMDRRLLSIRLNTGSADPKTGRTFKHPNLRAHVTERRNEIVSALLLLVQAWIAAGKPLHKTRLASFESYCEVIGGILDHVGIEGWLTNLEKAKESVAITNAQRLVEGLYEQFGSQPVSVGKLEIDERTDDSQAKTPTTICQYVLKYVDNFDWWWLKEIKTGWGGRIGRALTANRDRVYRIEDGSEVALKKTEKGRDGVRYFVELVCEAPTRKSVFIIVHMSPKLAAKCAPMFPPVPISPKWMGSPVGAEGRGFQIDCEAA